MRNMIPAVGLLLTLATGASAQDRATLFSGGPIISMAGDTPEQAEAVVAQGGLIRFVGPRAEAEARFGADLERIDLGGRTMLPGFIDAHSHFGMALMQAGGANLGSPPVGGVTNVAGLIEALREHIARRAIPAGGWVVGWNYDQSQLAEARHITRAELDAAFPDHKIVLLHVSMHGAVLNGAALTTSGITAATADIPGGVIGRDGDGEPNGLLMEAAMFSAMANLPQPTMDQRLASLEAAQAAYFAQGYTQAQEGAAQMADIRFLTSDAARARIRIDMSIETLFTELPTLLANPVQPFGEWRDHVKLQGVKFILDGSPQARTAFFTHPYLQGGPNGERDWHGTPIVDQPTFNALARQAHDAGLQLFMHANGDAAIDMAITGLESLGMTAADNRRPVVIHSQFQRLDQLPRYAALGVSPSYFTNHTFFWGDVHVGNVGTAMASGISPMRSAQALGLHPSNHSDYPVTALNTRFMLWSAMARTSRTGVVIGPDQRVDAYAALQALTTGPAWQMFEESRKGRIAEGLLADFVILDRNPLDTPLDAIRSITVVATIKDGVTVYGALPGA
jgi:predicted amidohydrolase YtcJ